MGAPEAVAIAVAVLCCLGPLAFVALFPGHRHRDGELLGLGVTGGADQCQPEGEGWTPAIQSIAATATFDSDPDGKEPGEMDPTQQKLYEAWQTLDAEDRG